METVVSDALLALTTVSNLSLCDAGDAIDRRDNASETEVEAGGLDCGLAGLNLSLRRNDGCLRGLYLEPGSPGLSALRYRSPAC